MTTDEAGASPEPAPETQLAELAQAAVAEVRRVVVGQEHLIEQLMVALIARGHCLLRGRPGVAKTLAVRTLSEAVSGSFARMQLTADVASSDVIGSGGATGAVGVGDVDLGPVFANVWMVDELSAAPTTVQWLVLDLMDERQALVGGHTYPLADPFMTVATQTALRGVEPLAPVQRDRFLFTVDVGQPCGQDELEIVRRMSAEPPKAKPVLSTTILRQLQGAADSVFIHNLVAEYMVRLVLATRSVAEFGLPELTGVLEAGAGPRATLGLAAASRAVAVLEGRSYVLPADVVRVAADVMAHRLVLSADAAADDVDPRAVVELVLRRVPAPHPS
jgi:MoxR-like ATPase